MFKVLRAIIPCLSLPSAPQEPRAIAPGPVRTGNNAGPGAGTDMPSGIPPVEPPQVQYPTAARLSRLCLSIDGRNTASTFASAPDRNLADGAAGKLPEGRKLRRTQVRIDAVQMHELKLTGKQAFGPRQFEKDDLVYGVEKARGMMARDRNHYIQRKFDARHLPCKISDFRVLMEERHKSLNRAKVPEGSEAAFLKREGHLIETLAAHPKYQSAVDGAEHDNSAVRRKSKGGLFWATKIADKHVHFILDGLDIESVVKKSFSGDNGDRPVGSSDTLGAGASKNRSVTGAELRWIYRNRDDSDIQEHVHFWFEGKPCRPPWEEYTTTKFEAGELKTIEHDVKALWSQYVPKGERGASAGAADR